MYHTEPFMYHTVFAQLVKSYHTSLSYFCTLVISTCTCSWRKLRGVSDTLRYAPQASCPTRVTLTGLFRIKLDFKKIVFNFFPKIDDFVEKYKFFLKSRTLSWSLYFVQLHPKSSYLIQACCTTFMGPKELSAIINICLKIIFNLSLTSAI